MMLVSLAAVSATAGCAGNEYGVDDGVRDLQRDVGLSSEQAECVIDGLEGAIGRGDLRGFAEATREQREILAGLLEECI